MKILFLILAVFLHRETNKNRQLFATKYVNKKFFFPAEILTGRIEKLAREALRKKQINTFEGIF